MLRSALLLALIAFVVAALSVEAKTEKVVFDIRSTSSAPTSLWTKGERVGGDVEHSVVFVINPVPNAEAACDKLLMSVSDPKSAAYGQHLTLEEVGKIFSNSKAYSQVLEWLSTSILHTKLRITTFPHGDFLILTGPVRDLEALLEAEFYHFKSKIDKDVSVKRTATFSLPEHVAQNVDFVGATTSLPPVQVRIRTAVQGGGSVDPATINSVYKIDSNLVDNPQSTQALFEALGQDFSPDDLKRFETQYNIKQTPISQVIGPNNPNKCTTEPDDCGEANLDVEYIMAVAQGASTLYWSISANVQDPFLNWVLALANMTNPPLVHSISYGSISKEDEKKDVYRFNLEACKLGLRGVTILVSSGDDGVANFEARENPSACGFSPSFPATSPYVTAVGATQGPESGKPEIACSSATGGIITTGGGFSFYFPRPSYQDDAVKSYLKNAPNLPPTTLFNFTGRGYPDVAVLGYNYNVIIGGQPVQESGTSASAPVFAGMITLINNARLNSNKPPLGFLNPVLYQIAKKGVFHDVTVGENNCCAYNGPRTVCCEFGFNATKGWDPVTGFGSPIFPRLKSALLSLPLR